MYPINGTRRRIMSNLFQFHGPVESQHCALRIQAFAPPLEAQNSLGQRRFVVFAMTLVHCPSFYYPRCAFFSQSFLRFEGIASAYSSLRCLLLRLREPRVICLLPLVPACCTIRSMRPVWSLSMCLLSLGELRLPRCCLFAVCQTIRCCCCCCCYCMQTLRPA